MIHLILMLLIFCTSALQAAAPYINSQAIKERFDSITATDMDLLRSKKILFASRSFGLNLNGGLAQLAKKNNMYAFLDSYQKFDVFKAGGDVKIIPADIFKDKNYVHFLATYWPHTKRIDEIESLLTKNPHQFHETVDIAIIYFHTAKASIFDTYAAKMDAMREAYPNITFIYVCSGYMAEKKSDANDQAKLFNDQVIARYKGKVPLYDLGAILSDDHRDGNWYCPEYSKDPAGVHPNLEAGQSMMAKGFLLVLHEALSGSSSGSVSLSKKYALADSEEKLSETHSEYIAVRNLLDANGLKDKKVESVAVVKDEHVVALYLQEGGVHTITDDIGKLRHLKLMHLYGDRKLEHPLLKDISPAIGKCTRLEELLLNHNELTTLPKEIAKLKKVQALSLADNKLVDLPKSVQRWAEKFDAEGMQQQTQ
ncbi:MAG: leucine-rich repeat domain-containing protein [Planctomycetes bacterium]|nr:leucine-rich repeat domain-containing protein [Planctomycetota bacterium]